MSVVSSTVSVTEISLIVFSSLLQVCFLMFQEVVITSGDSLLEGMHCYNIVSNLEFLKILLSFRLLYDILVS